MASLLDSLPAVIARPELKQDDVSSVAGGDGKSFILVHSRPITVEEKDLLRSYGDVLEYSPAYTNIPLSKLRFQYLLLDINVKESRVLIQKNSLEPYHVVCICRWWEREEAFLKELPAENILRHLPARSPFKEDFERMLLTGKVSAPSCILAVWKLIKSALQ
jgi:hypothetical protein